MMNEEYAMQEMYFQAEEQFDQLDQPRQPEQVEKNQEEDMTEEQREQRRKIIEAQLKNKHLVYWIHQKEQEIQEVQREIEDHKFVLNKLKDKKTENNYDNYLNKRGLIAYDTYIRGRTREQDKKIYELELNNADKSEIDARIEKINKEYEKNIQPLVVGEFKTQIENEIKGYKNQIESLRSQFKEINDDINKLQEKNIYNLDMYSTLQRQLQVIIYPFLLYLQEHLLANEQLQIELNQIKSKKE